MDYLTRVSMEHGQIYESLAIFKKALDIEQGDNYTNVDKLSKFFNDLVIPHFQYEEGNLFPLMLERGSQEEQQLTRELIVEHGQMLKDIDAISDAVRSREAMHKYTPDGFISMVKGVIRVLLTHASKEDTHFYPNLKKYLLKT